MRRLWRLGCGLLLVAGCSVGTSARGYAPAKGPAGAILELRLTDKTRMTAELLAVEDSSFLLLHDAQVTRVPLSQVQSGHGPKVSFSEELGTRTRERLRLISRYPQGVSAELEGRLLQAYGQTAVVTRGS
jgi:hypothetical protein